MTDLRTAAQQALEALEYAQQGRECPSTTRQAITALKAALAEPAQERNFCPRCGKRTTDIHTCTPPQEKPVAWIHTDPDKPKVKFLEWREDEPGYRGRWVKTPLCTARG